MRLAAIFSVLLSALVMGLPVQAAPLTDAPVSLHVTLDRAKTLVGDPASLRLEVTHPAQTTLRFPDPAVFERIGLEAHVRPGHDLPFKGADVTTAMEYTIVGFRPLIYVFRPAMLEVAYETPNGQRGVVAVADPIAFTVESVLAGESDTSLRGIRPPVPVGEPSLEEVATTSGFGLVAVALMLLAVYLLWRRRALPGTPEERAREALREAALLFGPGQACCAFYTRVADTIRVYLSERTDLPALTSTTRELRRRMAARGISPQTTSAIMRLLEACDAVKWAHDPPSPGDPEKTLALALEIVGGIGPRKFFFGTAPQPGVETSSPTGAP